VESGREGGDVKRATLGRVGDPVTPTELAELSDAELVALIVERTGKRPDVAREILTIIRSEIPENTVL
jgi:hypothetical protein